MANPPPQISGTLRDTINSLGFGLIVAVLLVNFSKLFLANFFVYVCGTVFTIEVLLFSLYKPNTSDIEVYREPGRRGKLRVESGSDEIVDTTSAQPSPSKKNPAGKKKDKQTKKAEKEKEKHQGVAHHSSGEKKRESLTVATNVPVELGSEPNSPSTSPSSPTGEKSNTWKRKLGHKWENYKEKREEKKTEKDKEKDKDHDKADNENKNSDNVKKEEDIFEEKEPVEPKDEKIEDVAVTKDNEKTSRENVNNKEKEEGTGKDDPFDEEFCDDDDEDKKEKPKMKLKWPKKRPKSTSSLSCFNVPKLPKEKSRSAEDVNESLPDG